MSCLSALEKLLTDYQQAYLDCLGESPRYYAQGEASNCILVEDGQAVESAVDPVYWRDVQREHIANFDNVAHALSIDLHPDINEFYGHRFAAPIQFDAEFGEGELLQSWNEQDFEYLQQNMIGHLMMKSKLKQPSTWFIGVLGDGDVMLTVNNESGAVCKEIPGEVQGEELAPSLETFIQKLRPRITPPVAPIEEPVLDSEHQGLGARLKRMWHSLVGKESR